MFEKYRLRRGLNKKQSLTKGDFVSEVIYANFGDEEHNMVVDDEKVFDEVYKKTCEDFAELEKADLLDFWRKEYTVLSLGVRSEQKLYTQIKARFPRVALIGDAAHTGRIADATAAGYAAAKALR